MAFIKESFLREKAEDYRLRIFVESYIDWQDSTLPDTLKTKKRPKGLKRK